VVSRSNSLPSKQKIKLILHDVNNIYLIKEYMKKRKIIIITESQAESLINKIITEVKNIKRVKIETPPNW